MRKFLADWKVRAFAVTAAAASVAAVAAPLVHYHN